MMANEIADRGYVKPREAHFIKLLAKKFIHECGQKILDTIIEHQRETLPVDDATCVVALCVRLDEVPPGVGIQLYPGHGKDDCDPERSYEENTKIYVTAQLPPTHRQERAPPLVEVMVITMWELRDRAEHFETCKDHAACVARVQGRPPKCRELETLGQRCDRCLEVWGPDEDPWGAPDTLEYRRSTY